MQTLNRFDEPIHLVTFPDRAQARRFTKMVGANPRRFALIGMRAEGGAWVVRYRSRSGSPWSPDPRATWPAGGAR